MTATLLSAVFLVAVAAGTDVKPDEPARAPSDFVVFDSDRAGAYFVARSLKEDHDKLLDRIGSLRDDVVEARVDAATARAELAELQAKLDALRKKIEGSRVYIAGAVVHTAVEKKTIPVPADGRLLIDAADVDLRAWNGPDVRFAVEKTVLAEPGKSPDNDMADIRLEIERIAPEKVFGYDLDMAKRPEGKARWAEFPFRAFTEGEFTRVRLGGLVGQEGNRMMSLKLVNKEGAGEHRGEWRRRGRLVVYLPKCKTVGVIGGLAGFRVSGVEADVVIRGEGDRDYSAKYEVTDLNGSLVAENFAPHRIAGVAGNVKVTATAFAENTGNAHDQSGVTSYSPPPRTVEYSGIRGDFTGRFVAATATLADISGRVDLRVDFGRIVWRIDATPAAKDHRILTEAATVTLALGPDAKLPDETNLLTECGNARLRRDEISRLFDTLSYSAEGADGRMHAWHGFRRRPAGRNEGLHGFETSERMAAVLAGESRAPGLDILSRGGTITVHRAGKPE